MIRENWRILLMVVFVVASGVALFAPTGASGAGANVTGPAVSNGPTNLQYGLELSGGTRIRAPLVGLTAEVEVAPQNQAAVTEQVASGLNLSPTDVEVRVGRGTDTVEVFSRNISQQEFARALRQAGFQVSTEDIRNGVTETTYETAVEVLESKISKSGLSGGTAQVVSTGEDRYILIEVPNQNRSEVRDLVEDQGRVKTVAYFPVSGNDTPAYCNPDSWESAQSEGNAPPRYCNVTVLSSQQAFQSVGTVQQDRAGRPEVPVTLTDSVAPEFTQAMQRFGFADPANSTCRFQTSRTGHCLLTVLDGRVVYAASVTPGLAQLFASGEFVNDPTYSTSAPNVSVAQELRINLQAGALPTQLALEKGTTQFILPSLATKFKTFSLITGLIAVLAVSVVIFIRYREPRVAIPMLFTALAEVFILLGFAAAVGLALDLSHIAGFIAVIGTGVDDLVIIADEILQSEVKTGRVFQSRFRRAFWVIGAAAATTIIAMSPLAVLSLGDLQGFAIVTIAGVLIGVLITRPAYGNVLRNLLTDA